MPGISVSKICVPFGGGGIDWSSYWTQRSLFFLDGSIVESEGSYYFKDLSANGRNFLITDYDFATDWTTGFPYKSAATISAPAGDAALIAADINNFLYDAGGTPNQIPVVSLFQDIDYEHKIFCKHAAQVVDGNGVETYEPRVSHIFMASAVLSGADLTKAQTDFGVPTEDTTTMVWLSPAGNDSTGDGSKANPYKTWSKIVATDKVNVYCKSGAYDLGGTITFTGISKLFIKGLGLCSNLFGTSRYLNVNRPLEVSGFVLSVSYDYGAFVKSDFAYKKCKITHTGASGRTCFMVTQAGAPNLTIDNCVYAITSAAGSLIQIYESYVAGDISVSNVYGSGGVILRTTASGKCDTFTFKHSNVYERGLISVWVNERFDIIDVIHKGGYIAIRADQDDNLPGLFQYSEIEHSLSTGYIISIQGTNEQTPSAFKGVEFTHNSIKNTYADGVGTCHSLLMVCTDPIIKYNYIETTNGYNIVLKSGGVHFTTTTPHISYNVLKNTGAVITPIYCRGAFGVIVANNTFIDVNSSGTSTLSCVIMNDADVPGNLDNSVVFINNYVKLSNDITYFTRGNNITSRNNSLFLNGHTLTNAIGGDDDLSIIDINASGIPAEAIGDGEITDYNIGLAADYVIPSAITYATQGDDWQRGAVIV